MKLTAGLANPTVHLRDSQLMSPADDCPLCGGRDRDKDWQVQSAPDVWMMVCRRCHAASASRMPTPETLRRYYASYYDETKSPVMADEHVTMVIPDRLSRHVARRVRSLGGEPASVLDFGGGDGTIGIGLARRLLGSGSKRVEVTVVDFEKRLGPTGDPRISAAHHETLAAVGDGRFDVVLASGILEHVPAPGAVLCDLLRRLRTGGLFYARTPYELPLVRLAGRFGARPELGFPGHLHDLGQRFWGRILDVAGLEKEFALEISKPSIVATTFRSHPFRTCFAYALKAPNYLLGPWYGLVGGWEVFIRRS